MSAAPRTAVDAGWASGSAEGGPTVSEGTSHEPIVAVGQLRGDVAPDRLIRSEPGELERVLGGAALTVDGDNEAECDRVLARVVEAAARRIGEVLDDGRGYC
jgi:hypothetical protein